MSNTKNPAIPVHIVTGFLGVGKTTLLNHCLAQKPEQERWAVVVNEFGQIGVDAQLIDASEGVQVKELPGGCLCCSLGLTLSVTLVNLLQKFRPDRLFIEPTGLGHPAGVIDLLRSEQFAEVLRLQPVITLLDPRQLDDPRVLAHEVFQDQIALADLLVLNKIDLATSAQRQQAQERAAAFFPPKLAVIEIEQGRLPDWALAAPQDWQAPAASLPRPATHRMASSPVLPFLALPQPGQPVELLHQAEGVLSLGWVLHHQDAVDEDAFYQWILELSAELGAALLRLKAVVRTGRRRWVSFNQVGGELVVQSVTHRRDGRIELLSTQALEAAPLTERLRGFLSTPAAPSFFDAD